MSRPCTDETPVAALVHVDVSYDGPTGPVAALTDVSLDFAPRSSTALVGRSGSGKSTLVSVLALMRRPTRGDVIVGGRSTARDEERERSRVRGRSIGVVFQSFHLDYALDAADNVMLPWVFSGDHSTRRQARARAVELLDGLGVADLAPRAPWEMSGGQRQRVAIARALYGRPPLLLADEPTGNLDEDTAGTVVGQLLGIAPKLGTSVVIVTHDEAVADMADRVVHLRQGRLADAPAADLFAATPSACGGEPA